MEKEAFWACLQEAGRHFEQQAATNPVTEEEEAALEDALEQDGELATLVARRMGLLRRDGPLTSILHTLS